MMSTKKGAKARQSPCLGCKRNGVSCFGPNLAAKARCRSREGDCPKCGSEMKLHCTEYPGWEHWYCKCGHEEKVGGEKR